MNNLEFDSLEYGITVEKIYERIQELKSETEQIVTSINKLRQCSSFQSETVKEDERLPIKLLYNEYKNKQKELDRLLSHVVIKIDVEDSVKKLEELLEEER